MYFEQSVNIRQLKSLEFKKSYDINTIDVEGDFDNSSEIMLDVLRCEILCCISGSNTLCC